MKVVVLHDPEADEVIGHVTDALTHLGHQATPLSFDEDVVRAATDLRDSAPDLVFNLTESFAGKSALESGIASLLNLLHLRYTGSNHAGLLLAGDKVLAKRILAFHEIRTPEFATLHRGAIESADTLSFPLIVKPPQEDASIGITAASVVRDLNELFQRMDEIHREYNGPVLVERFIEGREFHVGILGNDRAEALPPAEVDMSAFRPDVPQVASWSAKWDEDHPEYAGTTTTFPTDLDPPVDELLRSTALAAFRALRLRDYARVDLRLDGDGVPHVLEVNPNCYLARGEVYAEAAARSGLSYDELIGRIVELAASRYSR